MNVVRIQIIESDTEPIGAVGQRVADVPAVGVDEPERNYAHGYYGADLA